MGMMAKQQEFTVIGWELGNGGLGFRIRGGATCKAIEIGEAGIHHMSEPVPLPA